MGCTSSAPTVPTPDANATTEQSTISVQSRHEKDDKDHNESIPEQRTESDDTNVLPKCDTLKEPLQVDRNNKSSEPDLHSIDIVKENQENENSTEMNNDHPVDTSLDDKISSLREVVERVIEVSVGDCINGDVQHSHNGDQEHASVKEHNGNKSDPHDMANALEANDNVKENEDETKKDENTEEANSPSQSEASRVTRWEALADIAAELPPSLAVDPITGQIYALSK